MLSATLPPNLRPSASESLDIVLRGRVLLIQALKGYRSSIDATALAWFACRQAPVPKRALDLGAGTGLVGILLAMRHRESRVHLVERQAELVGRAERNLRLNRVHDRARVHHWDIAQQVPADLPKVDLIACNPPYHAQAGRMLPDHPERRDAHYESTADLHRFAQVAAGLLLPDGSLCMVYPSEREDVAIDALMKAGLGRIDIARLHQRCTEFVSVPCPDQDDHLYAQDIEDFIAELGPATAPETR